MQKYKKPFSIFLRISVSILLLWFLFRRLDKNTLIEIIGGADKRLLILAFSVFFVNYILSLFRWEMLRC